MIRIAAAFGLVICVLVLIGIASLFVRVTPAWSWPIAVFLGITVRRWWMTRSSSTSVLSEGSMMKGQSWR